MRQEEWVLNTPDGYKTYGVTDYASDEPSDKCLILVHGLTGHRDEYHIRTAAQYFVCKGYDVHRFNLYYWDEGGRKLTNCTLQTHAADLNHVLDQKCSSYKKVFISGHSYGGPTIMIAQPKKAAALSLWDPSFDIQKVFGDETSKQYEEYDDYFILNKGVACVFGRDFVTETQTRYDEKECLALSESIKHVPIQVLTAGGHDAIYWKDKKSWHSAGHPENEQHIIQEADHCFFRKNTLQEVLDHSYKWFERF